MHRMDSASWVSTQNFGLDVLWSDSPTGVYYKFLEDRTLPIEDRYIHSVLHDDSGGILIITFEHFLAQLIHKALSFEVDTTFKRTHGDMNEWEIVIWYSGNNRCKTCNILWHSTVS